MIYLCKLLSQAPNFKLLWTWLWCHRFTLQHPYILPYTVGGPRTPYMDTVQLCLCMYWNKTLPFQIRWNWVKLVFFLSTCKSDQLFYGEVLFCSLGVIYDQFMKKTSGLYFFEVVNTWRFCYQKEKVVFEGQIVGRCYMITSNLIETCLSRILCEQSWSIRDLLRQTSLKLKCWSQRGNKIWQLGWVDCS